MPISQTKKALVKTIIVINKKRLQTNRHEGFNVGATSFLLHLKNFLKKYRSYIGCIFYERDEMITMLFLYEERDGYDSSLCLKFNYTMP